MDPPEREPFCTTVTPPVSELFWGPGVTVTVMAPPAPFVAVPAAVRARCEDWALFADGGDDGAVVLRAVVAGAAARLAPGGWLMIVTEVPNIERAHRWLLDEEDTSGQLRLRVVYNPRHVQSADEYAARYAGSASGVSASTYSVVRPAAKAIAAPDKTSYAGVSFLLN